MLTEKLGLGGLQAINAEAPLVINDDLPTEAEDCFYLGLQYLAGLGCPQNDAQAVACFQRAAEQGYAPAQTRLGCMYANGHGPTEVGSAKEYRRDYKNGFNSALLMLKIFSASFNIEHDG